MSVENCVLKVALAAATVEFRLESDVENALSASVRVPISAVSAAVLPLNPELRVDSCAAIEEFAVVNETC